MSGVVVVADAGPIIALSSIAHLHLLQDLFARVIVPPAVYAEVTYSPSRPSTAAVLAATWIEQRAPDPARLAAIMDAIDLGEREAIAGGHLASLAAARAQSCALPSK